ncbi:hypothetical protein DMA11_22815 [Marinilabiliaceae bacterium JC017]|nr:hypothetical protein DMA11_22815 [Marinilabiliaceae bacterium JC017]
MKALKFGLLIALVGLFTVSCDDDDDYSLGKFIISMGTIEGDQDSYIIVTDSGDRLFPSASNVPNYPVEDDMRVWVNYTILGDATDNETLDYYVKINDLSDVLTKDIFQLTDATRDSIGNDPVSISDYWIARDYLNIGFYYGGGPGYIHYINLVNDENDPETEDGMLILELKHNKNNDPYNYRINNWASFDLLSIQEEGKDEVTFLLRSIGPSGEYEFEKEVTYKYGLDL